MQCNPIVIDGILYATSPALRVIALDAATGELRWSFDPNHGQDVNVRVRNRGLVHSRNRIYFTAQHYLYALDASTGMPVLTFGKDGRVDLREGLGRDPEMLRVSVTTPGVVYMDLLIMGSRVPEGLPSASGHIRAYDLRTGELRWIFHTIPQPGEFGYDTWPPETWKHTGGANAWAGMSVDEKRGLVFVPTGSAAFDFYGADRIGDNLFANTLLALRADTGERVWHFQMVRHDVWDRDLPAPPSLVTIHRNGRLVDAVAQITKSGHVFVFERESGRPLFPIEYRKVPTSDIEGEVVAETQPFPLKPPPFARQIFTEDMVTRRTPTAHRAVLEKLRTLRNRGPFDPPSLQGTVLFPGMDGGAEWGGGAFDPETGLFYVNANEMVWILSLVEQGKAAGATTIREVYLQECAICHNNNLRGNPPEVPSLVNIGEARAEADLTMVVRNGTGRMPGYLHLV